MTSLPRAAAALAFLMVASAAAAQCPDGSPPPCGAANRPPPLSVAVLGFRTIGGDSSDALLGEGLAEELTSQLGQVRRLSVTSRSVVRRLPNVDVMPMAKIGDALNSVFLVQGSLRRTSGRLRVTAELLRASTGALAWSAQYDRSESDILVLQELVATNVAQAVVGQLLPAERASIAARPTRQPEAYAAFLRGRAYYNTRAVQTELDTAVTEFRRAVTLDSGFAAAWAWLSMMHTNMYWRYNDRSEARLDSALAAANRARALAPSGILTHLAFGSFYYRGRRDYGRSLQELSAAMLADPRDPAVHTEISAVARRQGNFEQALASRTRGIDLDPTNAGSILDRAATLRPMRRYDDAERDLRRAWALNPLLYTVFMYRAQLALMRDGRLPEPSVVDSLAAYAGMTARNLWATSTSIAVWRLEGAHQDALVRARPDSGVDGRIAHYLTVGIVHASRGTTTLARAAFDSVRQLATERLRQRPGDDLLEAAIAQAYAGLGQCDAALSHAERAVTLLPLSLDAFTGPARLETLAEIEAGCGRTESAIDRLERLLAIPSSITPARLAADPAFAPLRSNPRFAALIAGR